jgi:hypothetical protein
MDERGAGRLIEVRSAEQVARGACRSRDNGSGPSGPVRHSSRRPTLEQPRGILSVVTRGCSTPLVDGRSTDQVGADRNGDTHVFQMQ